MKKVNKLKRHFGGINHQYQLQQVINFPNTHSFSLSHPQNLIIPTFLLTTFLLHFPQSSGFYNTYIQKQQLKKYQKSRKKINVQKQVFMNKFKMVPIQQYTMVIHNTVTQYLDNDNTKTRKNLPFFSISNSLVANNLNFLNLSPGKISVSKNLYKTIQQNTFQMYVSKKKLQQNPIIIHYIFNLNGGQIQIIDYYGGKQCNLAWKSFQILAPVQIKNVMYNYRILLQFFFRNIHLECILLYSFVQIF
eukprot:TRINITY_DN24485_c0_g1_i6.p2 TRINITY_DN24485_c0_g1~~TRINITY_DN24485_c0_g1_i6.p2  ORF type:complete len:273 (-),score=-9.20 TRINITY_DN24485_c0_g1_i6:524-1264(-)